MAKNADAVALYDALKRIAQYTDPDKLRRTSERDYGLTAVEAIEYAYENVLSQARAAIRGVRRPAPPPEG